MSVILNQGLKPYQESITFGNNKGVCYGNDYYWYLEVFAFPGGINEKR